MSETQKTTNDNPAATPARLLTPAEAAEILVIPVSTLNVWRAQRTGLPYVHIGPPGQIPARGCGGPDTPQHGTAGVRLSGDLAAAMSPIPK